VGCPQSGDSPGSGDKLSPGKADLTGGGHPQTKAEGVMRIDVHAHWGGA
jgi:hypothetical protein